MYHFAEGAIEDDSLTNVKSLQVISKALPGFELSMILISEVSDRDPNDVVSTRLEEASISLRGFKNPSRESCDMGGAEAIAFGWEFFDEGAGQVAAQQIIAAHGNRLVSISATFSKDHRQVGVAATMEVARAVRWRPQ